MSIQDYKQCIDCCKIILPKEIKLPYADGSVCLPCYLSSVDDPTPIEKRIIEIETSYQGEMIAEESVLDYI